MISRPTFTRIKGLSDVRRMPRLGKIRLGIKVKSQRTQREHPKEVGWFVCPPEVQAVYGPQPVELDIMFPVEDEHAVFPQALKWYDRANTDPLSSVILRCKGDMETAIRRVSDLAEGGPAPIGEVPADPHAMVEVHCPCALLEKGDCRQIGNLMVLLPKVSMGGVYQIDSGSTNNIIRINSYFPYLRAMVQRISLVPLKLRRVHEDVVDHEQKRRKHYLLQIELNANLEEVVMLREKTQMILTQTKPLALPKPVEEGVDTAPGAIVIEGEIEEEGEGERVPEVQKAGEAQEPPKAAGEPVGPQAVPTVAPAPPADTTKAKEVQRMISIELTKAASIQKLERVWSERIPYIEEIKAVLGDKDGVEPLRQTYLDRKAQLQKKGQGSML
jgi:hypothetical protein